MDSAVSPLVIDCIYVDRDRNDDCVGAGEACCVGELRAAAAAGLAVFDGSIPVRAAVCHQVEERTMSASKRIDTLISGLGDWRGDMLAEIRRLIHEADPAVVEDWKWMGTPVWSHDGMYALANPHKSKVKLTFYHGAKLGDPKKLINAGLGGSKWRAIDIFEGDKLNKTALKALLRAAIAYNTKHSVPKSRDSRKLI